VLAHPRSWTERACPVSAQAVSAHGCSTWNRRPESGNEPLRHQELGSDRRTCVSSVGTVLAHVQCWHSVGTPEILDRTCVSSVGTWTERACPVSAHVQCRHIPVSAHPVLAHGCSTWNRRPESGNEPLRHQELGSDRRTCVSRVGTPVSAHVSSVGIVSAQCRHSVGLPRDLGPNGVRVQGRHKAWWGAAIKLYTPCSCRLERVSSPHQGRRASAVVALACDDWTYKTTNRRG